MKKIKKSFIATWSTEKILMLGLVLGVCSILSIFYLDQGLAHWVHDYFQGRLDPAARIFTWFGLGDTYFLISVTGYLVTRLISKKLTHLDWPHRLEEARKRFSFMFISFTISGLILMILKIVFGRSRPYNTPDFLPMNFQPFTLDWNFQSYPSGHTQVGFTLASFISILYPKATIGVFIFASFVGFSRVVLEKHYLGDVLAGAFIGILGTFIAWKWKGSKLHL